MPNDRVFRATSRLRAAEAQLMGLILHNAPRDMQEKAALEVAQASSDLGYLENQIRAAVQI